MFRGACRLARRYQGSFPLPVFEREPGPLSTEISKKQFVIRIEKSSVGAKQQPARGQLSGHSENMLQRGRVFRTVSYLVRTKNKKKRGFYFSNDSRKNRPACTHPVGTALAPGKGVLPSKKDQHWNPRRKGI